MLWTGWGWVSEVLLGVPSGDPGGGLRSNGSSGSQRSRGWGRMHSQERVLLVGSLISSQFQCRCPGAGCAMHYQLNAGRYVCSLPSVGRQIVWGDICGQGQDPGLLMRVLLSRWPESQTTGQSMVHGAKLRETKHVGIRDGPTQGAGSLAAPVPCSLAACMQFPSRHVRRAAPIAPGLVVAQCRTGAFAGQVHSARCIMRPSGGTACPWLGQNSSSPTASGFTHPLVPPQAPNNTQTTDCKACGRLTCSSSAQHAVSRDAGSQEPHARLESYTSTSVAGQPTLPVDLELESSIVNSK